MMDLSQVNSEILNLAMVDNYMNKNMASSQKLIFISFYYQMDFALLFNSVGNDENVSLNVVALSVEVEQTWLEMKGLNT
jgi:hypothetical protein